MNGYPVEEYEAAFDRASANAVDFTPGPVQSAVANGAALRARVAFLEGLVQKAYTPSEIAELERLNG